MTRETLYCIKRYQAERFEKPRTEDTNNKRTLVVGGNTKDINFFIEGVHVNPAEDVMTLPLHKLTLQNETATFGGNGLNLSTALGRLGQKVSLITPAPSEEMVMVANNRGVDVIGLHTQTGQKETIKESYILNAVDYPGERSILRKKLNRDYKIDVEQLINSGKLTKPDAILLSSVDGDSWQEIYQKTTDYALATQTFLAVLPGSEQNSESGAKQPEVHYALENANLICANKREMINLLRARDIHVTSDTPLLDLILHAGREFGYDQTAKRDREVIISLTDGGNPSLLYTKDDRVLELERFGNDSKTPLGAGDAYAGALADSLIRGESEEEAIVAAAINGYSTTLKLDAQSGHQTQEQIKKAKKERPDFVPRVIFDQKKHSITTTSTVLSAAQ